MAEHRITTPVSDEVIEKLRAGDTVYIRAGSYLETIQPSNSGGSEAERIVYQNYGTDAVIFRDQVYCIRVQSKGERVS